MFSTWPTPQALADALRVNQTVKLVDLHGSNLGNEGVKARPRRASQRRWAGLTLHCILDSAHDTTKSSKFFDAQALADALRANKTITSVNLCHNKIGNEGFKVWPPQGAMARVCGTMRLSRKTEPSFLHSHCVLSPSYRRFGIFAACRSVFPCYFLELLHRLIQLPGPGLSHRSQ